MPKNGRGLFVAGGEGFEPQSRGGNTRNLPFLGAKI